MLQKKVDAIQYKCPLCGQLRIESPCEWCGCENPFTEPDNELDDIEIINSYDKESEL